MSGSHFIAGEWVTGAGPELSSHHPATGELVWSGRAATTGEIGQAMAAARAAAPAWAGLPLDRRTAVLQAFADGLRARSADLAETISRETGKPRWESRAEVASMIAKVGLSLEAYQQRCAWRPLDEPGGTRGQTRYKPHGVLAVFGPFNMPGHLPNGHIVPALLVGDTIVFKPSEYTPAVARQTVELWQAAGLPAGVLNLVQGGRETGAALSRHPDIDGVLFTGSYAAGVALARTLAEHPQKILALEMGGNNPLVVWDVADLEAAAYATVQSAYLSAGQRCTCARRLILPTDKAGDAFLERLLVLLPRVRVGLHTQQPEPFYGPVISPRAADGLLVAQTELARQGGRVLAGMQARHGHATLLSPGLIDVTRVPDREDREHFGPLLQVIRVPDFDAALAEANRTAYGLVAALLSDRRELYDRFYAEVRAGLINWNRQTTNASSRLPFGGVGHSGNHRPSGFFAVDYCAYPVATLEAEKVTRPSQPVLGIASPE